MKLKKKKEASIYKAAKPINQEQEQPAQSSSNLNAETGARLNCKDNGLMEVCNMEQVVDDPLMLGYRMAKFQNINCIKQVKIHVGVKFFFGKMGVKARIEEKCENVKLAKEGK